MKRLVCLMLLVLLTSARPGVAQQTPPTPTPDAPISPLLPSLATVTPTATTFPIFPLRPGSIEGNINDAAPAARYSFTAASGDSVTIRMDTTSGDLDPLLLLYAPDGSLLERNDDQASGNRNALIALTLDQNGTYVVEAARFVPEDLIAPAAGSSGTFRLVLEIEGGETPISPSDPLGSRPDFGVPFTLIDYETFVAGTLDETTTTRYYAIGGRQGDLVRATSTRTNGDLVPRLRLLNRALETISREAQTTEFESSGYVTLPETGWYLLEVTREDGSGRFDLYVTRLASEVLAVGSPVNGTFSPGTASASYIINARISERVAINVFTTETESGITPELRLLNLNLREIDRATGERFATLNATIPRSGQYILQVNNLAPGTSGGFRLRLTRLPATEIREQAEPIAYNNRYESEIDDYTPLDFYAFSGKTGELVTLDMSATNGNLAPYLILMDSDLNELAFNGASISGDAHIVQYRLPKDSVYYALATRNGLERGTSSGAYTLTLTAGAVALTPGAVAATLRWEGAADLNLFVRGASGQTVSWSTPRTTDGGTLEIDSNTGCQTPSAEPVEHIVWETLLPGDYTVWAWYQDSCGTAAAVDFTLAFDVGGERALATEGRLLADQRFEMALRVTEDGRGFVIEPGAVANPSPQQRASEGGDPRIGYGETLAGTLDNDVYARFYRFSGRAGEVVEISADTAAGDLDPLLILRDQNDSALPGATNDDADAATRNARLRYTLPSDGDYIIVVTRFGARDGTTIGSFRLRLTQVS
jgi:hypothetical protein